MAEEPRADILLVDDSPEKLLTLEVILAELGQNLVKASSGREALRHLLAREFAAILLDVNMPGLDGFETAHLIRQRKSTESTPIIFITAFSDDNHVRQGYELGAVDYIVAPVIPEVLRTKVSVFVDLFRKTELLRRQASAMERRTRQLVKLADAALGINAAATLDAVLEAATRSARTVVDADEAVAFATPDGPVPRLHSAIAGELPGERERVLAQAAAHTAALPSGARERRGATALAAMLRSGPDGAWLSAPLAVRAGRTLGWLHVRQRGESFFTEEDASLLTQLSQTTALALENLLSAEAREANRLKDEFLTTLSHELRTPLTAILGWTRLLRSGRTPAERTAHGLEVIERNVKAQAKLIDDLLDVSRIVTGKLRLAPQPIAFVPIVESAIDAMRPAADARGVAITLALDAGLAGSDRLTGDADRLQQVVLNLLSNAVKFTPKGGRVTVSVRREKDGFVLQVADTGRGIPPSFLPHVFERFRQGDSSTTRVHGGLGIGLSLVRHIVELHGGTAEAASEGPDKGAVFTVRVPVSPPNRIVLPLADAAFERGDADLTGVRILLVDDEPDAREVVREILCGAGALVTTASSAAEALERLEELPRGGVVVSDIAMPDGDGFSLVREIRARPDGGRRSVIALSAYAREEDVRRALREGFDRHVSKPVEPAELLGAVAELAGERAAEPSATRRILVVEDNVDSREALKALLEMSGFTVDTAETGSEGVEKALATRPEVAVVDIGLPEMDGFEVARRIRDRMDGSEILLIALTGYNGARERKQAAESGFDAYLAKPVNVDQLDGLLARTVRRA